MPRIAILLFLFAINTLWAADAQEIEILDLSQEKADIDLKVIDKDRKSHYYSLHSKVLQKSRYFRIIFGLEYIDTNKLPLQKTYNISSRYIFEQIILFLYKNNITINNFSEFSELLFTQEQLQIEQFDEYLYNIISDKNLLEKIQEQELVNILKFLYISQRPSANLIFDLILKYIGTNDNFCQGCTRKKISSYPRISPELRQKIEVALCASQEEELPEVSTNKVSTKKRKGIF